MLENTREIVEEIKGIKDYLMIRMTEDDVFMDMAPEELVVVQKCFKLVNLSCDLAEKQASMIDQMDRKMDLILEKLDKVRA